MMRSSSHKHDISFGACLEIQDLSFIRSFVKGNWVSSIYTPPVTAEFLRQVSLKIVHGEVHGIIGATGSGKSTLLKVVANRLEGKLDGKVLLNGQNLTRKRFSSLCEYVDFKTKLLPSLTVEQILHYHARLALNCKSDTVNYRVFTLMQQFDLGPIADRTMASLREADRRRLLIAMHLVKDPVLIVIDEPIKGLDALTAFQLMSSLQDYTKRQARMALVTMRCPRSDIYQLLAKITLLFYGEVIYSGPTKEMPHYFNNVCMLQCPPRENPPVYYLSLASVDRETPESYAETHTKAMKLVEIFRDRKDSIGFLASNLPPTTEMPILSSFYGVPSTTSRIITLISRHLAHIGRSPSFCLAQTILPILILICSIFGASLISKSWHIPKSIAGSFFSMTLFTALAGVWTTVIQFNEIRSTMFFEISLQFYNGFLMFFVYIFLGIIFDFLSIGLAAFIFVWKLTDDIQLEPFISTFFTIWCIFYVYKSLTLAAMVVSKSSSKIFIFGTAVAFFSSIISSGFIKSYMSFLSLSYYLSYLTIPSIEKYANLRAAFEFVNSTAVLNCSRNELKNFTSLDTFCRWTKGNDYIREIYPDNSTVPQWWNAPIITVFAIFIASIFYILITQKCAQKKLGKFE